MEIFGQLEYGDHIDCEYSIEVIFVLLENARETLDRAGAKDRNVIIFKTPGRMSWKTGADEGEVVFRHLVTPDFRSSQIAHLWND